MRRAGIRPRAVRVESYSAKWDPQAPLQLSFFEIVAQGPDCPDWSENLARDPQNLPWPNMGCATQKNLAAMVADPQDFLYPRIETPRPGERRDVVWQKYVKGEPTISKRDPSEHANASEVGRIGGASF
jgi:pilus assembly protein CpaD